ncbi:MAG TPA: hypothetical protein VMR37_01805 [Rhabdochlamydiaceae bacterium]|nr:hypothetical protein [Rhabdochlamydiaceae bacterium]
MIEQKLFFHCPFSPSTVAKGEGPALLLQFILRELLRSEEYLDESSAPQMAPFDWAWKQGSAHKVREFAHLLPIAFPELALEASEFLNQLHSPCVKLFALLEPFIRASQKSENLLYFLLKHQKSPTIKLMLDKICPEGPEGLGQLKMDIVLQYQKRGFYPSKWIN